MAAHEYLDLMLKGSPETELDTVAVSHGAYKEDTIGFELGQEFVYDRFRGIWHMFANPDIELVPLSVKSVNSQTPPTTLSVSNAYSKAAAGLHSIYGDSLAVEEVWDVGLVSIGCERICQQSAVDELDAYTEVEGKYTSTLKVAPFRFHQAHQKRL